MAQVPKCQKQKKSPKRRLHEMGDDEIKIGPAPEISHAPLLQFPTSWRIRWCRFLSPISFTARNYNMAFRIPWSSWRACTAPIRPLSIPRNYSTLSFLPSCVHAHIRPSLDECQKLEFFHSLSITSIFEHMHGVVNVDKKITNCTV
jgi:hypothetical protein